MSGEDAGDFIRFASAQAAFAWSARTAKCPLRRACPVRVAQWLRPQRPILTAVKR